MGDVDAEDDDASTRRAGEIALLHTSMLRVCLRLIMVLSLPVILTMGVVRGLTTPWFIRWEYSKPDFPKDPLGLPPAARLTLARETVRYLNTPDSLPVLTSLTLPDGRPAYNAREVSHMVDVKRVYTQLTAVAVGCLVGLGAAVWWLARHGYPCDIWRGLLYGGSLTLGILFALGLWMLTSFQRFFKRFHDLFFAPGTWTFSYSDTLIRLFPLPLWQDAGLTIAVGVSLLAAVTAAVGFLRLRHCWQAEASPPARKHSN